MIVSSMTIPVPYSTVPVPYCSLLKVVTDQDMDRKGLPVPTRYGTVPVPTVPYASKRA